MKFSMLTDQTLLHFRFELAIHYRKYKSIPSFSWFIFYLCNASLQLNLQNAGYCTGVVDGLFGQQTETAVLNFQRDRGLIQDGVVGSTTESALIGKSKGMGGSGQDPYTTTTDLQQLLTKRGCYSGSIDGIYGPQTTAAVRRAQGVYGLVVDGVAGSATYRADGTVQLPLN